MDISGAGGGLMFAAAAAVWLVYLMPTWFKRREYLATERNAVRLQQTLRVLAETAEMPSAVRLEATARTAAAQERLLREHQKSSRAADDARIAQAAAAAKAAQARVAEEARITAKRLAEIAPALAPAATAAAVRAQTGRRIRRTRLAATLLGAAGIAVILTQVVLMAFTGVAAGAWVVLGFASIASVTGVAALGRLSAVSRRRIAPVARQRVARRVTMSEALPVATPLAAEPELAPSWTPVPVPKPLYLSRPAMPKPVVVAPSILLEEERLAEQLRVAEELRLAAAEAERALREAHAQPEVIPMRPASKFASMGIIDTADIGSADAPASDIDAVLRRRRAAG